MTLMLVFNPTVASKLLLTSDVYYKLVHSTWVLSYMFPSACHMLPDVRFSYQCWWQLQIIWGIVIGKYLLTHSMVQSPSWAANWFAASQEIPRISRNPKVHYRTDKRLPPVSILGQPNPVHIPTSHLLEIRTNIIHPSTPRFPQWSPSLRFPH